MAVRRVLLARAWLNILTSVHAWTWLSRNCILRGVLLLFAWWGETSVSLPARHECRELWRYVLIVHWDSFVLNSVFIPFLVWNIVKCFSISRTSWVFLLHWVRYAKKPGKDPKLTGALWGAGDLYRNWINKCRSTEREEKSEILETRIPFDLSLQVEII